MVLIHERHRVLLRALATGQDATAADLARMVRVQPQTVSDTMRLLVRLGWVTKWADGRQLGPKGGGRINRYSLTEVGRAHVCAFFEEKS